MAGVKFLMLIIGFVMIVIPEPATTGAGILLVLASFGVKN